MPVPNCGESNAAARYRRRERRRQRRRRRRRRRRADCSSTRQLGSRRLDGRRPARARSRRQNDSARVSSFGLLCSARARVRVRSGVDATKRQNDGYNSRLRPDQTPLLAAALAATAAMKGGRPAAANVALDSQLLSGIFACKHFFAVYTRRVAANQQSKASAAAERRLVGLDLATRPHIAAAPRRSSAARSSPSRRRRRRRERRRVRERDWRRRRDVGGGRAAPRPRLPSAHNRAGRRRAAAHSSRANMRRNGRRQRRSDYFASRSCR